MVGVAPIPRLDFAMIPYEDSSTVVQVHRHPEVAAVTSDHSVLQHAVAPPRWLMFGGGRRKACSMHRAVHCMSPPHETPWRAEFRRTSSIIKGWDDNDYRTRYRAAW